MIVLPGTARGALRLVATVALLFSGWWWWGIQSLLTDNVMVAAAFTIILVIAPPALTTFLVPWSPAGMLLQKINGRTWGFLTVVCCALYYIYYSWDVGMSYWLAQPVAADTGLVSQQVWVQLIGFILIPALLWAPVGDEELQETLRQDHLIRRYQLQTEADLNIYRAELLEAQEYALVGFSELLADEQDHLAGTMRKLLGEVNGTLRQIGIGVEGSHNAIQRFKLPDAQDVTSILDYQHKQLTAGPLANYEPPRKVAPVQEVIEGNDLMSQRLAAHTTPAYESRRQRTAQTRRR